MHQQLLLQCWAVSSALQRAVFQASSLLSLPRCCTRGRGFVAAGAEAVRQWPAAEPGPGHQRHRGRGRGSNCRGAEAQHDAAEAGPQVGTCTARGMHAGLCTGAADEGAQALAETSVLWLLLPIQESIKQTSCLQVLACLLNCCCIRTLLPCGLVLQRQHDTIGRIHAPSRGPVWPAPLSLAC
jgi:hypothetical protein